MITLEDLKKYLKILSSDTSQDNQLNLAIWNAIWFLESYIWVSLELNSSKIAFFDWEAYEFELPDVYINSLWKIEYADSKFEETFVEYTWNKFVDKDRWFIETEESVGPFVKVTYSFWYDDSTCPGDLKMALLDIASIQYKKMWKIWIDNIKSETVDWDQIILKDLAWVVSDNTLIILDKYRRYGFSA